MHLLTVEYDNVDEPKNDLCYEIPFVVIKGDYIPLLGSQTAQQMHLLTVEYDNVDEPFHNEFSARGETQPGVKNFYV